MWRNSSFSHINKATKRAVGVEVGGEGGVGGCVCVCVCVGGGLVWGWKEFEKSWVGNIQGVFIKLLTYLTLFHIFSNPLPPLICCFT